MHSIEGSCPSYLPVHLESCNLSTPEQVLEVFKQIIASVLVIYFAIQIALEESSEGNAIVREEIFKDRVIVETCNRAKFEDINTIARLHFSPFQVSEPLHRIAVTGGFTPTARALSPSVLDDGKCTGGTLIFLRSWLLNPDIDTIAPPFKNGVPLEGVLLHETYRTYLSRETFNAADLSEFVLRNDEAPLPDADFEEGIAMLRDYGYPQSMLQVLQATRAFKQEGKTLKEDNLLDYVNAWFSKAGLNPPTQIEKATIEHVMRYDSGLCHRSPLNVTITSMAGLKTEKMIVKNGMPQEITRAAETLDPGAYQLHLPQLSPQGKLLGHHTVGFAIDQQGTAFLYDPNLAIGEIPKGQLQHALDILLLSYRADQCSENTATYALQKLALA